MALYDITAQHQKPEIGSPILLKGTYSAFAEATFDMAAMLEDQAVRR